MTMTTICIHLFHHFILITLLLLYNVAIIDFLEELAYVRRRRNKKKKKEKKNPFAFGLRVADTNILVSKYSCAPNNPCAPNANLCAPKLSHSRRLLRPLTPLNRSQMLGLVCCAPNANLCAPNTRPNASCGI